MSREENRGRNIVLIGMPGSGKSSLGRRLSKKLGMPLVDTDVLIETLAGMRISDIFAAQGEAAFRDLESRCAREAAALSGVIISTGGGMILRPENMDILAQNGLILFIDRHPAHIVRDMRLEDRPLVRNRADRVWQLHGERIHLYRHYAHRIIPNRGRLRRVVLTIVNVYKKQRGLTHALSDHQRPQSQPSRPA